MHEDAFLAAQKKRRVVLLCPDVLFPVAPGTQHRIEIDSGDPAPQRVKLARRLYAAFTGS